MDKYLKDTVLLNYKSKEIQDLIQKKNWADKQDFDKIKEIYDFVRDDIAFGYNESDNTAASQVLAEGYGQCNTKGILFMALLRAVGIPCRIHGFAINKELQKGAIKGLYYKLSPNEILHSWVEVFYEEKFINMEGFILDIKYLQSLQNKYKECSGAFCGYGVATNNFNNPPIYWEGNDTYIQKEGIVKDFGVFDTPDELFEKHSQNLNIFKEFIYKKFLRQLMNKNIKKIRDTL